MGPNTGEVRRGNVRRDGCGKTRHRFLPSAVQPAEPASLLAVGGPDSMAAFTNGTLNGLSFACCVYESGVGGQVTTVRLFCGLCLHLTSYYSLDHVSQG